MTIMLKDGRRMQGTALQIVGEMRSLNPGWAGSVRAYVEYVVDQAEQFEGAQLRVTGTTDEEQAASLVNEMLLAGLAERVRL